MCHKIPRFVEKAAAAGVKRVFIGLENINPDNLSGAKKKQNHIADYREMLQAWRKSRAVTYCGYIIGFPNDTPKSVVRDIEIIKRELPLDILQFSCLTPLPGSEDHAKAVKAGADIDPDLNKFDLEHVVCDHPRMVAPGVAAGLLAGVGHLLHRRSHEDGDPPRRRGRGAHRHGRLPDGHVLGEQPALSYLSAGSWPLSAQSADRSPAGHDDRKSAGLLSALCLGAVLVFGADGGRSSRNCGASPEASSATRTPGATRTQR